MIHWIRALSKVCVLTTAESRAKILSFKAQKNYAGDFIAKMCCCLTLKAPRKMHLKMSSAEVDCCQKLPCITDQLGTEANIVDPEQTAPLGAV